MQKTKTLSQLKKEIDQAKGETGTTAYRPKSGDEQQFMDMHKIEIIDDANGNDDAIFKGMSVKPINRQAERHGYDDAAAAKAYDIRRRMPEAVMTREQIELDERELSSDEMKERERLVKGMKKGLKGFKKRYGADAKSVMYATATKLAKEELEIDEDEMDVTLLELFVSLDNEEKEIMVEMIENGIDKELFEEVESEVKNG